MKKIKGFTLVELLVVVSIIAVLLAVLIPAMNKAREIAKRTICSNQTKQLGVGMAAYAMGFDDKMPYNGGPLSNPDKDESVLHPFTVYRTGHPGKSGNDNQYQSTTEACLCGKIGKPIPMRLACLFEGKFIRDGKIFYCPSTQQLNRRYDSYTLVTKGTAKIAGNTQWGMPHQASNFEADGTTPKTNDWTRVGYDYYPIDRKITHKPPFEGMLSPSDSDYPGYRTPKATCRKFSNLHQAYPYVTDAIGGKNSITHYSGKREITISATSKKVLFRSAGINSLFKDGHVSFVQDKKGNSYFDTTSNDNETLFDNAIWTKASPGDEENTYEVKPQVFYYYMYRFIGSPGIASR